MAARIIELGHGAGGVKMRDLIAETLGRRFAGYVLDHPDDAAVLAEQGVRLAFTTDGFVVRPLFFPGGDIGRLAVCGTVNDLAMAGAVPKWISVALIIEEGVERAVLERIADSIGATAREAGVAVVTGDTKVVERGSADGIFITTSGIGFVPPGIECNGSLARPGMKVIVSGDMGDHELAILNAREKILESDDLKSDCAPLNGLVSAMLEACPGIACLRDPTRGGLATALNEIAAQSGVGIEVDERAVPMARAVAGACDLLGLDPLYMANEGKLIAIVEQDQEVRLLKAMHAHELGKKAAAVGRVTEGGPGTLVLLTSLGGRRVLDMASGRLLPRIC